ncbi:hypothetical protein PG997_004532 [Apiospora hydei]|uniref:RING-type domain-containing protein n=1 Tax=Apiospora hydei TaxID=1337664 RepID=A0ABR1X2C5_9PEZI
MLGFVQGFIRGVIQSIFIGYNVPRTCQLCHASGCEPEPYPIFVTLLCGHSIHVRCIGNRAANQAPVSLCCPICRFYFDQSRKDAPKSGSANGKQTIDMPKRRCSPPPPPRPPTLEMVTVRRSGAPPSGPRRA